MATDSSTDTRIIGYIRCSTTEQAADGMSLDAQEARIRAWADAVGAEVAQIVTDAGVSGMKPLPEREGGATVAALLDSRKPDVDAVVVVRLDRLGRDAAETLTLLKRFRTSKVGLVSLAERIDLATPSGRAMAGMTVVFAELERGLIAQRTTDALDEIARQGRPWNHDPFGWDAVDGRLVPNEREQTALAQIRELREAGVSYDKIAKHLISEQVATKRGGTWAAATVRSVLRSADKVGVAT
jgi:DNA invertase Pin-like site-specific DNA recombinase